MAEEHRCEAPPEGHHLCANNCGFFGSPATLNLCSKCYRDFQLKEEQASSAKSAIQNSLSSSSSPSPLSPSSSQPLPPIFTLPAVQNAVPLEEAAAPPVGTSSNRCLRCRKRVGLTGFKCKCGMTYCGVHRYPEKHACTYDFRKDGREAIAKANPVVKAEKLDQI